LHTFDAKHTQQTGFIAGERIVMATTISNEAVFTLNDLIETLKDGKNGFEAAASDVKDERVKAVFQEFAQQRSQLASELQAEVRKLGGDPEKTGSTAASMHRGWMNIKSALGGGEKSILNEAERGEDSAVKSYEKALAQDLPAEVSGIVRRQYGQVKQAHDRVRDLRDSWK
jgi:uncharacterized protein (TIGR02284 family)